MSHFTNDIANLLLLQSVDTRVLEAKRNKAVLPKQIADLQQHLVHYQKELSKVLNLLSEKEKERTQNDAKLAAMKKALEEAEGKLSKSKTGAQFNAATKEIEFYKKDIKKSENGLLAMMLDLENLQKKLEQQKTDLESRKLEFEMAQQQLSAKLQMADGSIANCEQERSQYTQQVSKKILDYYERVLTSRKTTVLAALKEGKCSGCNIVLPPPKVQLVLKFETLVICENCHRVVYNAEKMSSTDLQAGA